MQIYCDEVVQQSEQAQLNISGRKMEMLIGSISKDLPPHLMLNSWSSDNIQAAWGSCVQ